VLTVIFQFRLQPFLSAEYVNDDKRTSAALVDAPLLQLASYASLQHALSNAEIILLYFAASWCPMSTPITDQLKQTFPDSHDGVLKPVGREFASSSKRKKAEIAIVYVSSDINEIEAQKYGNSNWIRIPFNSLEGTELKRHFKTCSANEAKPLNVNRRHGIPNIIVIDSRTHDVISNSGIKDLANFSGGSISHWREMMDSKKGLNVANN